MTTKELEELRDGTNWGDALGRIVLMVVAGAGLFGLIKGLFALTSAPEAPATVNQLLTSWMAVVTGDWLLSVVRRVSPAFGFYKLDFLYHLALLAPAALALLLFV